MYTEKREFWGEYRQLNLKLQNDFGSLGKCNFIGAGSLAISMSVLPNKILLRKERKKALENPKSFSTHLFLNLMFLSF